MKKIADAAGYAVLAVLIIAQCVIRQTYIGGQFLYLVANIIAVVRCFILNRPRADKVKDIACTAITTGLVAMYFLS